MGRGATSSLDRSMYIGDPICCKIIPGARGKYCNDSYCCNRLGRWGIHYFDVHRKPIMLFMTFLAVISAITSLIPLISISHNSKVVMDTYWTRGNINTMTWQSNRTTIPPGQSWDIVETTKSSTTNLYIGLTAIIYESNDHIASYRWENTNCTLLNPSIRDYCNECHQACEATISVTIINFITSLPTITTNLKRSTPEGDLNCSKFMSILTGIIGTITTLSSISLFLDGCFRHLPEETIDGRTIEYSYGPGLICIIIPQILKPLDVLVNLMTPVSSQRMPSSMMEYDHKLLISDDEDISVEL